MLLKYFFGRSYLLFSAILIIFELILILKGNWVGDFWEHSAVVNELSKNLNYPKNPIFKINSPHPFFSPYSILVAIFSKITHFDAIKSLEFFAFFNLVFFLFSFFYFCKSIFKENYTQIATLGLFFVLVFWGNNPIQWSGFLHFFVLNNVLPYPSTFAISLVLLILSITVKNIKKNVFNLYTLLNIIFSVIVFISHPTTAILLFVALSTLNFVFTEFSLLKSLKNSLIVIIPCIILSLVWPYFSISSLIIGDNYDFQEANKIVYFGIIKMSWPILLIIPGYFIKQSRESKFFYISILGLIIILTSGYILKIYMLSRTISSIMLLVHILISYQFVLSTKELKMYNKLYIYLLAVMLFISIGLNLRLLAKNLYGVVRKKNIEYYNKFNFLESTVESDDLILANKSSNWIIPTFNGKVISSEHSVYGIADINMRRKIISVFFTAENSDSTRQLILLTYKPDYLLIDHKVDRFEKSTYQWFKKIGTTVYYKKQLELIKVNKLVL